MAARRFAKYSWGPGYLAQRRNTEEVGGEMNGWKRAAAGLLVLSMLTGCGGRTVYEPPVNEDGYIVITMPEGLVTGEMAEELEGREEEPGGAIWSTLQIAEDGSVSYCMTEEQYQTLKAVCYWYGCLRNPYTAELMDEVVTAADYTDFDRNGIPRGLVVSMDPNMMDPWYSAWVVHLPRLTLGQYQILCGVPEDEWSVHVTVKNAVTGEVALEGEFPDREA